MHAMKNWKAQRAGGHITVNGSEMNGSPAKVTGIASIQPRGGKIIATERDGTEHELTL